LGQRGSSAIKPLSFTGASYEKKQISEKARKKWQVQIDLSPAAPPKRLMIF